MSEITKKEFLEKALEILGYVTVMIHEGKNRGFLKDDSAIAHHAMGMVAFYKLLENEKNNDILYSNSDKECQA